MNRSMKGDISFASLYSEDIDISKLASHLKLLPGLSEDSRKQTFGRFSKNYS